MEHKNYEVKNRLTQVKKNSAVVATFTYNGDGQRVKQTLNGVTTTFVGETYEITGAAVKKHYHAGAQIVAYRDSGTLRYVIGDHLGSSTMTADASGGNVTRQLFKAWGETRSSGSLGTKYQFTGQYNSL
jgi:YD repeat-containing protein